MCTHFIHANAFSGKNKIPKNKKNKKIPAFQILLSVKKAVNWIASNLFHFVKPFVLTFHDSVFYFILFLFLLLLCCSFYCTICMEWFPLQLCVATAQIGFYMVVWAKYISLRSIDIPMATVRLLYYFHSSVNESASPFYSEYEKAEKRLAFEWDNRIDFTYFFISLSRF